MKTEFITETFYLIEALLHNIKVYLVNDQISEHDLLNIIKMDFKTYYRKCNKQTGVDEK